MPIENPDTALKIGALITGLGGGLALFLFGMRQMTEALKVVAGSGMKNLLARLTANRFTSAVAGAIVTAVIQSSSVTTVLIVGFISAGLMNLSQSIGVIIGANIGTTVTAQIIAFKVYQYGLLMIATGFFIDIVAKGQKLKRWGMALMGLGLIFFGMELMSTATGPLRDWPPFLEILQNLGNPFIAIFIGACFTAIVQSSSATTGIVIVFASQGILSLESGIGLILGANIGTCVTAILSAIGRPREAVQAAWVHVFFNLGGVLLWLFFIPQFADFVRSVSPASVDLGDAARLSADTPRQIANAHTLFNIVNGIVFIWFTGSLARLVERLVPAKTEPTLIRAMYLDEYYLETPALALDQVRRELIHLGTLCQSNLDRAFSVVVAGSHHEVTDLSQADDEVDQLHGEIIKYLGKLTQLDLVNPQPKQLYEYIAVANYLENIGDVVSNNLMDGATKRLRHGVTVSSSTIQTLRPLFEKVVWAFNRVQVALASQEEPAASDAVQSKAEVNALADSASAHLAKRLVAPTNRIIAFQVETDIIENLKRLNTLTRRIGRAIIEAEFNKNGDKAKDSDMDEKESGEPDQPGKVIESPSTKHSHTDIPPAGDARSDS